MIRRRARALRARLRGVETLATECAMGLRARTSRRPGTRRTQRATPVIVSLTSYGRRIDTVHLTIECLLRQSSKPDRLILWLAEGEREKDLPSLLERQVRRGLEIRYCEDLRSYKKIIPTLELGLDSVIVTADDDCLYGGRWLEALLDAHDAHPRCIHCHIGHWMTLAPDGSPRPYLEWKFRSPGLQGPSALLFATGCGGVLYPPGSLPPQTLDSERFMELSPTADDVWLKAMTVLAGYPVRKVAPNSPIIPTIRSSQETSLMSQNVGPTGRNDEQIEHVFGHFGIMDLVEQIDAGLHQK